MEEKQEDKFKLFEERKEMILNLMKDPHYVPMKTKELAMLLDVPKSERSLLSAVLDSLMEEGKISISKRGKYARSEVFSENGIFTAHPKGFGFVKIEGREEDVFIPPDETKNALDGDTVQVVVSRETTGKRQEGVVLKILKHANETVIGLFEKNKNYGFVIPDNPRFTRDVFIPSGKEKGAVTGHKVVVRLKSFGGDGKNPEGEVEEILGHINDPGVDILSVSRAYGFTDQFPPEVMDETEGIPEELTEDVIEEELENGRLDLRETTMVTIDGEDAKDLDDAISLSKEETERGVIYHLGVHIADVSHYVRENHPLDREAKERGTSVYLVDRVIPMLPHRLSNGICSLNAGEDRLALSCLMDVDEKGNITDHKICETIVRIDKRMSYNVVHEILTTEDGEEKYNCEYGSLIPMFREMLELSLILREKRHARGGIDFDFGECQIIMDEKGKPKDIVLRERNESTKLIEDFMLAANETVAEDYFWQQIPFLYRSHEKPEEEKVRQLAILLSGFGYTLHMQNGSVFPMEYQKVLDKMKGRPEEAMLSRMALRSMNRARYTTDCSGHFGLAASYYTHFTSPIRRYPDLQIHRIIKEAIHGKLTEKRISHYEMILPETAIQSSARERLAEDAERETEKIKKVQYMSRFIGKKFDGIISGVTQYGFYVELPNTVEGMVHVNELDDDYYVYDEVHCRLIGEQTGRTFVLGQKISVYLTDVDRYMKTIDFIPDRMF